MGWWLRLAGVTEHLTLDVLMKFEMRSGQGVAALRWIVTRPHVPLSDEQNRIALVALLYARTLINHQETRRELFARMAHAARGVLEGDGNLTFEPWHLHVAGRDFSIWPWVLTEPGRVSDAKTYTATLRSTYGGSLDIHLKMAFAQTRILAPSSALIAAFGLARALNETDRTRLARVLLGINWHYRSSDNIRLRSEASALATAIPELVRSAASSDETSVGIIGKTVADHIFTLTRSGWEAYAPHITYPLGWNTRLFHHDSGTGIMTFNPTGSSGRWIQPLYDGDTVVMLIAGISYPPGVMPPTAEKDLEGAVQSDLGSNYSVSAKRVTVGPSEAIELTLRRTDNSAGNS